jgi:hypothetical protein
MRPHIHRLGTGTIESAVRFAQRQEQEIDQRIGDADRAVGREPGRLVERRMHEIMRDPAGAIPRRKLARVHLVDMEPAFTQQFLRHDYHFMPRQRRADDRMRAGDVIGEAIARLDLDLAAILFEIGNAVGLEQDLDVGVLAAVAAGNRMRDPMLARLDLAQLQLGNGGVVDPALQRRGLQRVNMELAAKIRQCI